MINICTIQFNTHTVTVNQDEHGTYHVFKFTDRKCAIESFTVREEAEEYILYPFPSVEYSLVIHDD